MRLLSSALQTLLSRYRVETFFLVSIANQFRFTTLPYDITMSDGLVYLSDGGLKDVEPPRISSSVDREAYKISIADVAFGFRPYLEAGMVGQTLEVRVGFVNNTGAPLLDYGSTLVEHDMPLNNLKDTFLAYKGTIDSHMYDIDTMAGEALLTIEGSSPMADLDLTKTFFTNRDSLRKINASDNSFDEVYAGSSEVSLRWGKK